MTLIDKAEALAVLRKAQVASCTCQIKTPDPEWHSHNCRYRILREAEAMIDHLPDAALPARGVGVKPLVWKQEADNAWAAAHYAIHQYWPHNNGPFAVSGYLGGLGAMSLGKHPTLDAAKSAAQADYEARILAALAPTDAATQKGGDAHDRRLRSHEASPGVTAGADAAQTREAALMVALHDAVNAPKGVVPDSAVPFWNAAILRAMEGRDG
jgi:hypothetical protein